MASNPATRLSCTSTATRNRNGHHEPRCYHCRVWTSTPTLEQALVHLEHRIMSKRSSINLFDRTCLSLVLRAARLHGVHRTETSA